MVKNRRTDTTEDDMGGTMHSVLLSRLNEIIIHIFLSYIGSFFIMFYLPCPYLLVGIYSHCPGMIHGLRCEFGDFGSNPNFHPIDIGGNCHIEYKQKIPSSMEETWTSKFVLQKIFLIKDGKFSDL